ncbi:hypothetical protein [Hydrogenivirga sp. 128-5-R1-1]|uniref:hypothetical protein n=1 Tax=Hydrogenivirga sp. 128-5-R1-1 TaxID=392423 RepID=UPI00015F0C86|nr:hypothetical protein [Hydrogenivirga sp. 128-5-R1-1]EDP75805.1 hypothetical protein HG1285_05750 [Hydrogenivirga sp. 128-5-R1-1]
MGGGDTTSTSTSKTAPSGTYIGAAAQGDYAKFTVNNNQVTYEFTGYWATQWCGGTCSGTADLEAYNNGQTFWKVLQNGQKVADMLLANNLGLAAIKEGSNIALIIGLQHSADPTQTSVVGNYIYLELKTTGLILADLTVNNDGTFTYYDLTSNTSGSGCWALDTQNKVIQAKLGISNCSSYNPSNDGVDVRVYVKPGTNRKAIVVDYADGSGFGIGLEKVAVASEFDNTKTYNIEYFSYDVTNNSPELGTSKLEYKNNQWQYVWQGGGNTYCAVVQFDQDCNGNNYPGLTCATVGNYDSNTGNCDATGSTNKVHVFYDPTDKYYFAISKDNTGNYYIDIGVIVSTQ